MDKLHQGLRSRRVMVALLAVAALLVWAGYRATHPRLRLVARRTVPHGYRLLFSDGYPTVQVATTGSTRPAHPVNAWLDARCRPLASPPLPADLVNPNVSCGGNVLATLEEAGTGVDVRVCWKDGRRAVNRHPRPSFVQLPAWVDDAGRYCILFQGTYTPEGKEILIRDHGTTYLPAPFFEPDTARYLPIVTPNGSGALYDWQRRQVTCRYWPNTNRNPLRLGKAFVDGSRTVIFSLAGEAFVFAQGKLLATFPGTQWRWNCDGTVWDLAHHQMRLLQWRQGTPRLDVPQSVSPLDARITGVFLSHAWGVTAWGDGALIAKAENLPLVPGKMDRAMEHVQQLLGKSVPRATEGRRLTLYHHDRPAGSYTVPLYPLKNSHYIEELAFSRDGRYLAWVLSQQGQTGIYVFTTAR